MQLQEGIALGRILRPKRSPIHIEADIDPDKPYPGLAGMVAQCVPAVEGARASGAQIVQVIHSYLPEAEEGCYVALASYGGDTISIEGVQHIFFEKSNIRAKMTPEDVNTLGDLHPVYTENLPE